MSDLDATDEPDPPARASGKTNVITVQTTRRSVAIQLLDDLHKKQTELEWATPGTADYVRLFQEHRELRSEIMSLMGVDES